MFFSILYSIYNIYLNYFINIVIYCDYNWIYNIKKNEWTRWRWRRLEGRRRSRTTSCWRWGVRWLLRWVPTDRRWRNPKPGSRPWNRGRAKIESWRWRLGRTWEEAHWVSTDQIKRCGWWGRNDMWYRYHCQKMLWQGFHYSYKLHRFPQ